MSAPIVAGAWSPVCDGQELDFLFGVNLARDDIHYVRSIALTESNVSIIPVYASNFCFLGVLHPQFIIDEVVALIEREEVLESRGLDRSREFIEHVRSCETKIAICGLVFVRRYIKFIDSTDEISYLWAILGSFW